MNYPAARWPTALGAGAAGVAGFAPFGYFWAALASAAALVWLWRDASTRHAARLGFAYGAGLFGAGVSWVYVSLSTYGGMPSWLAAPVVGVFVCILSLYPALVGWIYRAVLARHGARGTIVGLPALWAFSEWVRGWAFSGFPWLSLGYSQVDSWLAGWAPVLGVYGVSWAAMLTAALLVTACSSKGRWRRAALPLAAIVWLGGLALTRVEWAGPAGGPLEVALVQGNISLDRKWSPEARPWVTKRYLNLTAGLESRDLVVWPESALPYYIDQVDDATWRGMRSQPADFVLGLLERRARTGRTGTFNSAVVVAGGGLQIYRKSHLVPFGEYLPLDWLFGWIIEYLRIPMSDLTAWNDRVQGPFRAAGARIGLTICYEDAFPEEVIKPLPQADLLVNISEDTWFGDSLGPLQRIQMARMRSLETARPMLRAANTGVSTIIDHRGVVTARSRQFVPTVVQGSVQPVQGATLYVRWGNAGVVALTLLLRMPSLWSVRRNH